MREDEMEYLLDSNPSLMTYKKSIKIKLHNPEGVEYE